MKSNNRFKAHRRALLLVEGFLRSKGLQTLPLRKSDSANGPDIVAILGSDAVNIEVKTVFKTMSRGRILYKASKISRKNDAFIFVVFPGGEMFFDTMESYLKSCRADGSRSFTSLARLLSQE